MKASKEHKSRQSRVINAVGTIQSKNTEGLNKGNNINAIPVTKSNNCLAIQREPIFLNSYTVNHPYKIGFSTFTSHSKATNFITGNIANTELKGFPVLWAGHTMLGSKLDSRFPDRTKDDVQAKGFWTRSNTLWQSIISSIKFLINGHEDGLLNDDTYLLNHPDIKTIFVYVSRDVFNEWRNIQGPNEGTYTHSPNIDSEDTHNCVSFALNKAWLFTMRMLEGETLDEHDKNAMLRLNEFIEGAVITLRSKLSQEANSSILNPGLQGYFLKFIQENYGVDEDKWRIYEDDIMRDLFGHNDDFAQ